MPTGRLGPIGPLLYVTLLLGFLLFNKWKKSHYRNQYVAVILILTFILLLSDILKLILFDFQSEINFIIIRILNFCIFFIYLYYLVDFDSNSNLFVVNKYFLKIYFWSVIVIAIVLFGQAFGFISFGEIYSSRTYFGIKLPFNKPVGLFELSDGKLGIIIAPIIFLCLIGAYKRIAFITIKWGIAVAIVLSILIVIMQSRSAYLGLAFGITILFLLYPLKKIRNLFIFSSLSFVILLIVSGAYKLLIAGLVGEGIYEKNVAARGDVLNHALTKFIDSPIIGVGHKNLILYKNPLAGHGVGVHNLFADHLGSGGLLATLPFIAIFVVFFFYAIKLYTMAKKRNSFKMIGFSIWLISSMTYIIVELFFYRGFYNEYLYFFLALGTVAFLNCKLMDGNRT